MPSGGSRTAVAPGDDFLTGILLCCLLYHWYQLPRIGFSLPKLGGFAIGCVLAFGACTGLGAVCGPHFCRVSPTRTRQSARLRAIRWHCGCLTSIRCISGDCHRSRCRAGLSRAETGAREGGTPKRETFQVAPSCWMGFRHMVVDQCGFLHRGPYLCADAVYPRHRPWSDDHDTRYLLLFFPRCTASGIRLH